MQGNSTRLRKRYSATYKAEMVRLLLNEEKSVGDLSRECGVHPNLLRQWRAAALERLGNVFKQEQSESAAMRQAYELRLGEVQGELNRMAGQMAWLRRRLHASLTRSERLAMVEWTNRDVPLTVQAELLGVSRSTLYYHAEGRPERNETVGASPKPNVFGADSSLVQHPERME